MSEAEAVRAELEVRFPYLAGAVRVQREKRLWVEVDQAHFAEVFETLAKKLGFTVLCTITGLDLGADLGFIYHLARPAGLMANVKTRAPKGTAIRSVIALFPGGGIFERELVDLFGASVEGLPPGARYPLPDDWPEGEHPLLKDWQPTAAGTGEKGADREG